MLVLYGTMVGFALAGLLASGFQAVTGRKLGFALEDDLTPTRAAGGIVLRLLAGPVILIEGALRRIASHEAGPLWIAAVLASACGWSFLWGVVLIETLLGLTVR